jgi:hypothetical protein
MVGQATVLDIGWWAKRHASVLVATRKPAQPRIPRVTTLRRLPGEQDLATLEHQVAAHNQALALMGSVPTASDQRLRAQSEDGKDMRGSRA